MNAAVPLLTALAQTAGEQKSCSPTAVSARSRWIR
jgi:hypothetical protein